MTHQQQLPIKQVLPFSCQVPQALLLQCLQEPDASLNLLKTGIEATLPQPNAGLLRWAVVGTVASSAEAKLQCEGVYLAC